MGTTKNEKQKQRLVELGLMEPEDTLIDFLQASYVERLIGKMGNWKQGWAYFTEKRLIILTGLLEENIVIPYTSIRGIGKCSQTFFPIGITITHEEAGSGKTVTDKISMMKRNKWLDFLAEKAGIAIS